ncbi:DUF4139 domain-containing protein [uncultured Desulfovibrio sp.]|uniref:DUF4139 domain-containing protein n=1 Tax=uncultured Desulfovibrio sp. TaxID=167968 RepID=UPI0003A9565F|nr:DUF4139 domain-containing protein [uncultured Desulfovibrio sp.]
MLWPLPGLALLLLMPLFCLSLAGRAADVEAAPAKQPELANPVSVLLSPGGGVLDVEENAPVTTKDGVSVLHFVIPDDAENLQLVVPGQSVARWSAVPQSLEQSGDLARLREELLAEQARLNGWLAAVNARLDLWQARPETITLSELEHREKRMQDAISGLAREQLDLGRRLKLVRQELERLPASPELGQRISVTLQKAVSGVDKLPVRYSYTLRNCGWQPIYSFNAQVEKGDGDIIDVRMMAEVWQFTGMDWRNTKLTLATSGSGPREPAPLPRWVVDSSPKPEPAPVMQARKADHMAVATEDAPTQDNASVNLDTSSVYATWTPTVRGLPEGRSRLLITTDVWKAPLQWLARPGVSDSRVWLMAKYVLPPQQAWPDGRAEYSVNGQSVAQGLFRPRGGEATLFFGADPRVSVTTTADSKKRGESGFIDTSKNWTWAWTYVVTNGHAKPVTVRLERPEPEIVDQGVSVRYDDTPSSKKDEKEHMLFWDVTVPVDGKAEVRHSVTISSPTKLPLLPDAP